MSSNLEQFTFVDLFAGIGGFHAALGALGGRCVYASEIDEDAAKIYQYNWELQPDGDIVQATTGRMDVPAHDVLAAGFPCQPFSKSGFQRGMDEARGTLFWNICRVLEECQPSIVLLENVRNIAGPRHTHEWRVIIRSLRELGYEVASTPAVFSPHLLPPERGGRPQVRDRVFIVATCVGTRGSYGSVPPVVSREPVDGWDPQRWELASDLPLDDEVSLSGRFGLTSTEQTWLEVWADFVERLRADPSCEKLPGFPIWVDDFVMTEDLVVDASTPPWKANFLRKNAAFYTLHKALLDDWLDEWDNLASFPASRRKFEWQAQDEASLWDCIIHLRPSGVRAKRATYVPSLVAITQTTVLGSRLRRLTPRECARLQGLPEWFEFPGQPDALTYRQLGNGVNVGVAYHVLREQMLRSGDRWRDVALSAPVSADAVLGLVTPAPA